MKWEEALKFFKESIHLAKIGIRSYTQNNNFTIRKKADKSLVTNCDLFINNLITKKAKEYNLNTISEEKENNIQIVRDGNYATIDPIDGTLGYIEHVNYALENKDINLFLKEDLGREKDLCLLIGIVENGQPRFGCCYHYVTNETIIIDAKNPKNSIIEIEKRKDNSDEIIYIDQREGSNLQKDLIKKHNTKTITQATLGLKTLYAILNNHKESIAIHRIQKSGIWDIMPTAVASKAFGAKLYDDTGKEIVYNKYINLPGFGATVVKGTKFLYVKDLL